MKIAAHIVGLAVMVAASASAGGISPELDEALQQAERSGEPVAVVLTLAHPPPLPLTHGRNPTSLLQALQVRFSESFGDILGRLRASAGVAAVRESWAASMVAFRAPAEVIRSLDPGEMFELDLDHVLELPRAEPRPAAAAGGAEPGLSVINAPKLWELGITGEGVTVMNLDTGVDLGHPALYGSWRGHRRPASEAWFDPVYGTATPRDYGIDPVGHGTMTMGVMVGLDPLMGDTVGVAFGAEWMAAGDSIISISQQVACLQWALDPDGNPQTVEDMPDVINCSWTRANPGCKETGLTEIISVLEAAGVAVVFAAGNDGPAPGSVRWPARMNRTETDVFAVGYVDGHDPLLPLATNSGRGPTECTGQGDQIKPEVVAPGVDVRTTWLAGQYATVSGSSFSTPHVSGALALLKQAFPEKSGTELKLLLRQSARDLGEDGEDNAYGSGCIDVYAAYLLGRASSVSQRPAPSWSLDQNYPNPFNPVTQIGYRIPVRTHVRLTVYNLPGLEVARLVDGVLEPGAHQAVFDGRGLSSGVYFCRMVAGDFTASRMLLLLR